MFRLKLSMTLLALTVTTASAQTITDPDEIAARLKFWATDSGDPVYYGEVRTVSKATKRIGGAVTNSEAIKLMRFAVS